MSDQRPQPDVYLLLDDYEKSLAARRSSVPSAVIPIDGPPARFLLEEYDQKLTEGAALSASRGNLPPDPDAPRLQLLIEEFNPAARYPKTQPLPVVPVDGPLDFEVAWGDPLTAEARKRGRWGALAAHLAVIALLVAQPFAPRAPAPTDPNSNRDSTQITLLAPSKQLLEELSQRKPDESPNKVFRGDAEIASPVPSPLTKPDPAPPSPEVNRPAPPQPVAQTAPTPTPPRPAVEEPSPTPDPTPAPLAAASPNPDEFQRGRELAEADQERPPAAAPPRETPKLILEDPKAMMPGRRSQRTTLGSIGLKARPDQVIETAIENMQQRGGGRQAIGEGVGASPNAAYLPPSPGNIGSGVELLSDPKGVDFRPYLTQILNSVRRNWFAVLPESARLGVERGRVAVQFVIDKRGDVPKLVISSSSNSHTLDRAAVAGVSASLPFPPLPVDYSGDEVRLQFVFQYNMSR